MFKEYDLKDNLHLQELALKKKEKEILNYIRNQEEKKPNKLEKWE